MANPNPPLENLKPFEAGVSGNPSGVTKEAATLRSISQTMWGLYYTDEEAYKPWAAKYPKIAVQIEARAKQAEEGHATAMTRVDTETVGPLKQSFTFGDLDKADDETILKLAGMELPK